VNCFCSLKFRYLSQLAVFFLVGWDCCELLLFFEIQIFVTAPCRNRQAVQPLWIAFVLWNSDICHSVVFNNAFKTLLWIAFVLWNSDICHSKQCVQVLYGLLWIAFVLWNSDICHSEANDYNPNHVVVNCFCSLKFRYLSQPLTLCQGYAYSCELLLFFEIQIFVTARFFELF